MKSFYKKYIDKKRVQLYIVNLFAMLFAWGGLFRNSFGCDTLAHMYDPMESIGTWLLNGRYLAYFINRFLYDLGILATDYYLVFFGITMLLLALALSILQEIFAEFFVMTKERPFESICFLLGTQLVFVNVFFGEHLMFTECLLGFGLSYLLSMAGTLLLTKGKWFWAFICILCSSMFFQMGVIVSAMVFTVYLLLQCRGKLKKEVFIREILSMALILGTGFLNMISSTVLARLGVIDRVQKGASLEGFGEKAAILAEAFGQIGKNSLSLMPSVGIPFLAGAIPVICLLIKFCREKAWKKLAAFLAVEAFLVFLVCLIPLAQIAIYFPPRIIFTFYVMQAVTFLIGFFFLDGRLRQIVGWCCCFYFVVHVIFSNVIVANHYVSNALDVTYAQMVYEEILDYEEETGNRITKIATVNDTNCAKTYSLVYYKRDQINERALGTTTYSILEYVTGDERNFDKVEMKEEIYQTYFEGKNWDQFKASEQLIFEGDTLYWIVF